MLLLISGQASTVSAGSGIEIGVEELGASAIGADGVVVVTDSLVFLVSSNDSFNGFIFAVLVFLAGFFAAYFFVCLGFFTFLVFFTALGLFTMDFFIFAESFLLAFFTGIFFAFRGVSFLRGIDIILQINYRVVEFNILSL